MRLRSKLLISLAAICLVAGFAAFYFRYGTFGLNVLLRGGGIYSVTVTPDDQRLTPSMRFALAPSPLPVKASAPDWQLRQPGLETAELPVLSDAGEVDRVLLTRLDPALFRFEVLTAPAGNMDLGDWMRDRKPVVVINGSYFDRRGLADTPVKSAGVPLGPADYNATHGVFAASDTSVGIHDLRGRDWRPLLDQFRDAMVSYPLLLAQDGSIRVKSDRRWLANRSFVGQDRSGRIVLATTKEASFSLDRLAAFLRETPLDLVTALNLDGGPVACQAVKSGSFERDFCGDWQTQTSGDDIILQQRVFGSRRWGLPIVLAAFPRGG